MLDFREILDKRELAEVTKSDLEKHKMTPAGLKRPKMKKGQLYTWDQINTAMSMIGFGPKVIVKLLTAINKVVRERLTLQMQEATTAGIGVGDFSPPLGMSKRDRDIFSSSRAMLKQFDQRTGVMARKDMLSTTRSMGLSLGHLKDDDIRKTLTGMSVRNKRKFMGSSMGMGMGSIDRWVKSPVKVKKV